MKKMTLILALAALTGVTAVFAAEGSAKCKTCCKTECAKCCKGECGSCCK